mmetsp:Transcript_35389/g.69936  ORF Transcript_35389/g.69936 Transcript_35389/m.69936 type:complete len:741 (-) Transcript_35389:71-2293(-)
MASADSHEVLSESIVKGLSDRLCEKRKQAANELEAKVKEVLLCLPSGRDHVHRILNCLQHDFIESHQSVYKKGGLHGFGSVAIALGNEIQHFLQQLLPPVLRTFQDDEARVRYYACEALYNVVKVGQDLVLPYFNLILDGLTKPYADMDAEVKSGAMLVDSLLKEIVTDHGNKFGTADFVLLLADRMKYRNPSVRQLLLSWISTLLPVPEAQMVSYVPQYLEGLFNMLRDQVRDVRHNADAVLTELLAAVTSNSRENKLKIISSTTGILVKSCFANDACSRMIALCWLHEFGQIQMNKTSAEPESTALFGTEVRLTEASDRNRGSSQNQLSESWMASLPEMVGGTLHCIDDREEEIARLAVEMDSTLLDMVQSLDEEIPVSPLVDRLIRSMQERESMAVRTACLQWICMMLAHCPAQMLRRSTLQRLFDPIFHTLVLPDEQVVVAALQVLANIMGGRNPEEDWLEDEDSSGDLFSVVTQKLLHLFAVDRRILETRGRLMIRQLCGHLDPRQFYVTVARAIKQEKDLELAQQLVQTFSWILLTAAETKSLREELLLTQPLSSLGQAGQAPTDGLFLELFEPWFHNPVSALALCLWAQQDDLACELTARFAGFEPTVDLLKQLDQLVQLLESPMFSRVRLRLLEPSRHPALVKCILALAMILPQAGAFNLLRERILVIQSGLLLETRAEKLQSDAVESGTSHILWWYEGRASNNPQPGSYGTEMASLLSKFDAMAAAVAPEV